LRLAADGLQQEPVLQHHQQQHHHSSQQDPMPASASITPGAALAGGGAPLSVVVAPAAATAASSMAPPLPSSSSGSTSRTRRAADGAIGRGGRNWPGVCGCRWDAPRAVCWCCLSVVFNKHRGPLLLCHTACMVHGGLGEPGDGWPSHKHNQTALCTAAGTQQPAVMQAPVGQGSCMSCVHCMPHCLQPAPLPALCYRCAR
jgi:hypothetical protein